MKTNRVILLMLALLGVTLVQNAQAFYNPTTGRWLSRDPIWEKGGVNLYVSMGNEPANSIDAFGLECVGHTCKPPGNDDDGLHFCGPPSPPPTPRPVDPRGFNPVPAYNPPDAGKPCCDKPAKLKTAKRNDPPPTNGSIFKDANGNALGNMTIHMATAIEIEGVYKDLQIYWTSCWRIDGTSGAIPPCSNKTECYFPTDAGGGPYVTTTRLYFLSCEGGKWTKKRYKFGVGYVWEKGKWNLTPSGGPQSY